MDMDVLPIFGLAAIMAALAGRVMHALGGQGLGPLALGMLQSPPIVPAPRFMIRKP
jgi:hypothetical protein